MDPFSPLYQSCMRPLLGTSLLTRVMLTVIKRDWGRLLSNTISLRLLFSFKYHCFIDLPVDDWVVDLGVVVVCFVVSSKTPSKSKWNTFTSIWFFEIHKYLKKKKEFCRYMHKSRTRNVLYIYLHKWRLHPLYVHSYVAPKVCLNTLTEMFRYHDTQHRPARWPLTLPQRLHRPWPDPLYSTFFCIV